MPVDYDGITLMRKPLPKQRIHSETDSEQRRIHSRKCRFPQKKRADIENYVVLDVETTGLSFRQDEIIQIGGVKIVQGEKADVLSAFVKIDRSLPKDIVVLTGITDQKLVEEGIALRDALDLLISFIDGNPVLAYNAQFDIAFIQNSCKKAGIPIKRWRIFDVMAMARTRLLGLSDYRLSTVAENLNLGIGQQHQALEDALLTWHVYTKLKEMDVIDD